jgi:hypothetical protein
MYNLFYILTLFDVYYYFIMLIMFYFIFLFGILLEIK